MLEERDYSILTAEISKATFGMTPSEYKKFKGLKKENLRDHTGKSYNSGGSSGGGGGCVETCSISCSPIHGVDRFALKYVINVRLVTITNVM